MRVNKRRRDAEEAIDDHVQVACNVRCERCGKEDTIQTLAMDASEAAAYFYDEGWRVVSEKLLCGKCRKKP